MTDLGVVGEVCDEYSDGSSQNANDEHLPEAFRYTTHGSIVAYGLGFYLNLGRPTGLSV